MKGYLKRILPVFMAVTLFVTVLMLCCIRNSDNKIEMSPTTAAVNNVITASDDNENRPHIYHSGELRGVWVPYFNLTDGKSNMSEQEFKAQFDKIVETSKENGMNALFVHVRSHCDAVYPSEYFPYAESFTDEQGNPPEYNPLEYMINTAHNAGLEFHAWINPYRVKTAETPSEISENSPVYEWLNDADEENDRNIIEYDGGLYLNPAKAEVRSLIINGIRELVNNYNVDGVHLDDYFYAFTESEYDSIEYNSYTETIDKNCVALSLTEWRQSNVNMLISGIYSAIKAADEKVVFGISPQGNMENDLDMGADIYSWCSQRGYIDYIAPQIYYNSENPLLPYESTVDSWKSIITNPDVKLYIGLALYKAGGNEDDGTWKNQNNIISSQIEYARTTDSDGFILYSWEYLNNEQTAAEVANLTEILQET